jgi:branched-chain amino acid aminotransferase
MAGFEGVKWAANQMLYVLGEKDYQLLEPDSKVFAVSRSIHYGLCLTFEGIRFFCKKSETGQVEAVFFNWDKNLERFKKGIAFNLSQKQQHLVPSVDELEDVFIHRYFREPAMRPFFEEMAELGAQGYFRPFTIDEEQSIGVTFPGKPAVRAVVCRYDRYLGEPFSGVVVPHLIRAVDINQMGCLKLGVNYLVSIKAVDQARRIDPKAGSALFLDDKPYLKLEDRKITEWDSSCCLFALRDGSVVKIPENNLILPSVTIQGIVAILRGMGVTVDERHVSYGELIQKVKSGELVTICSVGTAGILNRCERLLLVDDLGQTLAVHQPQKDHPLFDKLGEARTLYWDIYQEKAPVPTGMRLDKYIL